MICPSCKTNLQGENIYTHFLKVYGDEKKAAETALMYGATRDNGMCFGREIAIYSMEKDRTTAYRCPDCGHTWERVKT